MVKRFADKLSKQIKSTIKPNSLVYYKDRRPRDANYYHYRYPSPGSTPVGLNSDVDVNYRHGYRDSVHNIRDASHYINEPDDRVERVDINPHSKNPVYIDSDLNSVE